LLTPAGAALQPGLTCEQPYRAVKIITAYFKTKLQAMTAEISWTHNVVVLEKYKDPLEREFYIKNTPYLEKTWG